MSSAVVPQWKIALQQKLDKKKDDERRKLLEEEQRRLAALPPWKRMGMVPQNVIIISGGTKTVSKLSADCDTTDGVKQEEPCESKTSAKTVKSGFVDGSASSMTSATETRTNIKNAQQSNVMCSVNDSKLTNHVGEIESGGDKVGPVVGREGVDEEHVSSVHDNPFLKLDGVRRRKASPASKPGDIFTKGTESTLKTNDLQTISSRKIIENKTTDFIKVVKKQPDSSIRQRSRSASPRRAARENNVHVEIDEEEVLPQVRSRKNSVSDLRSRFGHAASVDDLKVVSRKHSESDDTCSSPVLSPRSPTAILDRSVLFDDQSRKVHINLKTDSSKRLSPTSSSKVSPASTVVSDTSPSTQTQFQKLSAVKDSAPSKPSETKSVSGTQVTVGSASSNGVATSNSVATKRQAPKAPALPQSNSSSKSNAVPAPTVVPSSTSSSTNQNVVSAVKNDLLKSSKPGESSNDVNATNHETLPDQPKTAILGDGQSSLRRKKGVGKMSASALISLSSDNSNDVQLSEHNALVRAARQEARASASGSKSLLRSARDVESRDTDSIPKGTVSSNVFGSKVKTSENHTTTTTTSKDNTPYVDAIPYPTNFRQPKIESTFVDKIPYPENFRQPKSNNIQDTSEPKAPSVKLVSNFKAATVDDIPRTNIDDVVLTPIEEDEPLDTLKLVNGNVEEKAPPKKIKKKLELEWIGFDTPTGKPSSMKSRNSEEKKMRISFNESNLSETFEYQSESSLLNQYLREERGMNGNPRVGNLPRQEAQVEEEDDDDEIDVAPSSESGVDNVLAHEGLQNYTPKDLQNFSPMSFRQQQQQETPKPRDETSPPAEEPDSDDIAITYDDTGDYFSSAGSGSAALLF